MNTIVAEITEHGENFVDIFSKLSNNRILFINDYVNDQVATDLSATLLLKDMEDNEHKITIFINSEGGDIRAVFMIYDMMRIINSPVEVIAIGSCMNELILLLAAGTKGMRYASKNAIICVSQLLHDRSYFSDLTDAKSLLTRSTKDNLDMMGILANCTKKRKAQLMKDFERKQFMTPKQALEYGLIDGIVGENIPNETIEETDTAE